MGPLRQYQLQTIAVLKWHDTESLKTSRTKSNVLSTSQLDGKVARGQAFPPMCVLVSVHIDVKQDSRDNMTAQTLVWHGQSLRPAAVSSCTHERRTRDVKSCFFPCGLRWNPGMGPVHSQSHRRASQAVSGDWQQMIRCSKSHWTVKQYCSFYK